MAWTRVVRLSHTDSTNSHLLREITTDGGSWPHLSVLVADHQTAGRGRSDRVWFSRPGESLTASAVIHLDDDDAAAPPVTWLPLLVGVAARRALEPWVPTLLKWPNDILLDPDSAQDDGVAGSIGSAQTPAPIHPHTPAPIHPHTPTPTPGERQGGSPGDAWGWPPKLGGILCELHPSGALVAGIGINIATEPSELPVPWATSIRAATGSSPTAEEVLTALGEALPAVLADWAADAARVRREYEEACVVVGRTVTVTGGGPPARGVVLGIADDGALVLETDAGRVSVMAGDVAHVR